MKEFLKSKGFKESEGLMGKFVNKIKGKQGFIKIDSRILWIIVIVAVLYLVYKAYFS